MQTKYCNIQRDFTHLFVCIIFVFLTDEGDFIFEFSVIYLFLE